MISNFWSHVTWAATIAAILSAIAWALTRAPVAGWLALALLVVTLVAAYIGADEPVEELGDADPHPLDPRNEELRRRLAMGRLANGQQHAEADDDELRERGW